MRERARQAWRFAPALAAGGLVLSLGGAAIHSGTELRVLDAREAAREDLERVALRVGEEVVTSHARLERAAEDIARGEAMDAATRSLSTGPYLPWWFDGLQARFAAFDRAQALALSPERLLEEIVGEDSAVIGAFTTPNGQDVIGVQLRPFGVQSVESRIGLLLPLEQVWGAAGLTALVQSGLDVSISDHDGSAVYWSSPASLEDAVASRIHLLDRSWQITAAPRFGWPDASLTISTMVVLGVLAALTTMSYAALAREPRSLQQALAQARQRLETKDLELSSLLRMRADLETHLRSTLTVDLRTGLPNRTSFIEFLEAALGRHRLAASSGVVVAVVQFAKLEGVGHSMGTGVADRVISDAADRLQRTAEPALFLARTGEKDLAICVDCQIAGDVGEFSRRLVEDIADRFVVGNRNIYSPATIGIALCADGYEHAPELLANAGLAASTAAEEGKRWSIFRQEAREARISVLQLQADLQTAIDDSALRLYFQPIVKIADGTIVGLEGLVRWRHPTQSWIGPDRFIPMAEGMGQMPRITDWVLQQAVAYSRQWLPLRDTPIYLTVNLTPRELNRDICDALFELLDRSSVPPGCIRVEVTETAVVRDRRAAARLISELNERGVFVLLDDFGTGYSSLSYLRDLPFHAVKLDKSFIQRMAIDARDFGFVKSIVSLVHYLGMECVAEGIETQEQLDLVSMVDVDYGQGFHFSPAVAPSEVELLINRRAGETDARAMGRPS